MNDNDLPPPLVPDPLSSPEQAVLCMIEAVWNTRGHSNLAEVIARHHTADFVDYSAPPGVDRGLAGVEATVSRFMQACPDGRMDVSASHLQGDGAATFIHFVGTHQGDLPGVPATGREVYLVGVRVDRVREGRIYECRAGLGLSDLMRCLQSSPSVQEKHSRRLSRVQGGGPSWDGAGQAAARVIPLRR